LLAYAAVLLAIATTDSSAFIRITLPFSLGDARISRHLIRSTGSLCGDHPAIGSLY